MQAPADARALRKYGRNEYLSLAKDGVHDVAPTRRLDHIHRARQTYVLDGSAYRPV